MKHIKTIGLAAMVIAALTAFVGVASASAAEFHATGLGVTLSGEQTGETGHKFTVTGSSITCKSAKFSGITEGTATKEGEKIISYTATTQRVHPEYSECTAFGFLGATVDTTGCQYIFHTQTGTVDLEECTN